MSVGYRREGPVTIISIERPDRRNAVDRPTAEGLVAAFTEFDADNEASVAILTGSGGNFCAGADLHAIAQGKGNRLALDGDAPMGPSRMRLSKPVIAAIEGYAVAGGLELALWCDLRVMAADATLGVFCRRFGVPLIDLGTIRLPRLIGHSRAMDMILTGRPVDSQEAESVGLANRIAPSGGALDHALALAEQIAAFPQACMRSDRQSALDQWSLDEAAAIENEMRLGMAIIDSGATRSGAARFASGTGRHGNFNDPEDRQ